MKKVFGVVLALCLVTAMLPTAALAAWVDDNPAEGTVEQIAAEDKMDENEGTVTLVSGELNHNYGTVVDLQGIMSYNYGTITTNNGEVIENKSGALIETNQSDVVYNSGAIATNNGEVDVNEGTITANNGTVNTNLGTITDNSSGTVINNLKGTVNGGTVENNYCYTLTLSGLAEEGLQLYSDDFENFVGYTEYYYIKEGVEIYIDINAGYQYAQGTGPEITAGEATLTQNDDGSYTLSDITSDITISAQIEAVAVTDITGIPTTMYVGQEVNLYEGMSVTPENASWDAYWEIVDAGTTGAVIDDPYLGNLTVTSEGTLVVRGVIEKGVSETEDFTKEFTITVKNVVDAIADAYLSVKTALAGNDLASLETAAGNFEELLDAYNNLETEQMNQLAVKLGLASGEEAYNEILDNWVDTNVILNITLLYQNYLRFDNRETASLFTDYYKSVFKNSEDENLKDLVRTFIPDIDDVYKDALKDARSYSSSGGSTGSSATTKEEEVLNPDTGDNSAMWFGVMAAAVSCLAACGALLFRKRTN